VKTGQKDPTDITERRKQELTFRHHWNTVWIKVIPEPFTAKIVT